MYRFHSLLKTICALSRNKWGISRPSWLVDVVKRKINIYCNTWLAILSTWWPKLNFSMMFHEGIKQYHNKVTRLIEVLNIILFKCFQFQTPLALPSTCMTWLHQFRTSLYGSDALNPGSSLSSKGIFFVWFFGQISLQLISLVHLKNAIDRDLLHLFDSWKEDYTCISAPPYIAGTVVQSMRFKKPNGNNQICFELIGTL